MSHVNCKPPSRTATGRRLPSGDSSASAARRSAASAQLAAILADGVPATIDVPAAGRLLGVGRATAYRLAAANALPCRAIRVGNQWRVPTRALLTAIGIPTPGTTPAGDAATTCAAGTSAAAAATTGGPAGRAVWHEFTGSADV